MNVERLRRELQFGRIEALEVCQVAEARQEYGRHAYLFVLSHFVAGEHAQVDRGLRESEVAQFLREQRDDGLARVARGNAGGRDVGLQVGGQVHDDRGDRLRGVVHDVNLLHGHVAAVHVVELNLVLVDQHIAQLVGILAREIDNLLDHNTRHGQVHGFVGGVAVNGNLLEEMAQLTGVVGGRNRKRLTALDGCAWIIDGGTSATGAHVFDDKLGTAFVFQLEIHGGGLVVYYFSAIDGFVVGGNLLGITCQCQHRQACKYDSLFVHNLHFFYSTTMVCAASRAVYSGA